MVRDEQGLDELPVVTNVDFSHTDPMWRVPQGAPARPDPTDQCTTFLDSAVS